MNKSSIVPMNLREVIKSFFKKWGVCFVLREIVAILEDGDSKEKTLAADIEAAVKKFEKK